MLMKTKKRYSIFLFCSKGEFIALAGGSGSGKTTLLKHFKRNYFQSVSVLGIHIMMVLLLENVSDLLSAQEIGMVFQNPENQLVMDTVIQELAFSLENIGLPSHIIQKE